MCLCLAAFFSLVVSEDSADANVRCGNIYKDFSDCFLELGDRMNNYQENVTSEKGVAAVCRWSWLINVCQLFDTNRFQAQATQRTGIKLYTELCGTIRALNAALTKLRSQRESRERLLRRWAVLLNNWWISCCTVIESWRWFFFFFWSLFPLNTEFNRRNKPSFHSRNTC